jgi:hypothetical protein
MCVYRLRCGPCHSPGDEVRVALKVAGPLWRFGRGERAKRRCLPEMSRGSADTNRVAPFCVRQLEVWVPLNHFGTLRDTSLSRRHWSATAFAAQSRNQCRLLKAAKPVSCPPGLARDRGIEPRTLSAGASTGSRHLAFTQHRDGREVEIDRICKAT